MEARYTLHTPSRDTGRANEADTEPIFEIVGVVSEPPTTDSTRRDYSEIWKKVDETTEKGWVMSRFKDTFESAQFANACKVRKYQNKKHKGLNFQRIGDTVWVQGRKSAAV